MSKFQEIKDLSAIQAYRKGYSDAIKLSKTKIMNLIRQNSYIDAAIILDFDNYHQLEKYLNKILK